MPIWFWQFYLIAVAPKETYPVSLIAVFIVVGGIASWIALALSLILGIVAVRMNAAGGKTMALAGMALDLSIVAVTIYSNISARG
jgi:hypothetical protein